MSSSKLQLCFELYRFALVLLKIKFARWKAHFLCCKLAKRSQLQLSSKRMVYYLRYVTRKERGYAWSLVAMASHIIALGLTPVRGFPHIALLGILSPYFTTWYCSCITHSQPSTLSDACLQSIHVVVVLPVPSYNRCALIVLLYHQFWSSTLHDTGSVPSHIIMISYATSCTILFYYPREGHLRSHQWSLQFRSSYSNGMCQPQHGNLRQFFTT
jgi:hypothetical protein